MSRHYRLAAMVLCCVSLTGVRGVNAVEVDSLVDALTEGNVSLGARYRYEHVRQSDLLERDANANTVRTRLSYVGGYWSGLRLRVEMDHVGYLTEQRFNNTRNGNTDFPVVADPKGADLNQLALDYQASDTLAFTLGRQRINLDNQRFVGGVGWRQNEQTFDALSSTATLPGGVTLRYAWIDEVQRIFGPDLGTPPAALKSDSHLLNLSGMLGPVKLVGFAYALDFDNAPALSSLTTGVEVSGDAKLGDWRFPLVLSYARQRDHGDNPNDYDADYLRLEAGARHSGYNLTFGYEQLGVDRDARVAVQTPLATLHAFQGFTDLFLNTPDDGLRDTWVRAGMRVRSLAFSVAAHRFNADTGGADYGREVNISAGWQARPWLHLLVKAAEYGARDFATDTRKLWAQATLTF